LDHTRARKGTTSLGGGGSIEGDDEDVDAFDKQLTRLAATDVPFRILQQAINDKLMRRSCDDRRRCDLLASECHLPVTVGQKFRVKGALMLAKTG